GLEQRGLADTRGPEDRHRGLRMRLGEPLIGGDDAQRHQRPPSEIASTARSEPSAPAWRARLYSLRSACSRSPTALNSASIPSIANAMSSSVASSIGLSAAGRCCASSTGMETVSGSASSQIWRLRSAVTAIEVVIGRPLRWCWREIAAWFGCGPSRDLRQEQGRQRGRGWLRLWARDCEIAVVVGAVAALNEMDQLLLACPPGTSRQSHEFGALA